MCASVSFSLHVVGRMAGGIVERDALPLHAYGRPTIDRVWQGAVALPVATSRRRWLQRKRPMPMTSPHLRPVVPTAVPRPSPSHLRRRRRHVASSGRSAGGRRQSALRPPTRTKEHFRCDGPGRTRRQARASGEYVGFFVAVGDPCRVYLHSMGTLALPPPPPPFSLAHHPLFVPGSQRVCWLSTAVAVARSARLPRA